MFVYNIFHLSKDVDREDSYLAAASYMSRYAAKLSSPTIGFTSPVDVHDFCKDNPDFNIDLSGYSPKDLSRDIFIKSLPTYKGWKLGEVGIWASNFLAWKAFLETDAEYLILMEDDCELSDDMMPKLVEYMKELPPDWDMYHHFVHYQDAPWYHPGLDVGSPHVCKAYQEWSNLCYVINRRSAKKLLAMIKEGVALPLDWFWSKQLDKINVYTVKPKLDSGVRLRFFPSTFQATDKRLNLKTGTVEE